MFYCCLTHSGLDSLGLWLSLGVLIDGYWYECCETGLFTAPAAELRGSGSSRYMWQRIATRWRTALTLPRMCIATSHAARRPCQLSRSGFCALSLESEDEGGIVWLISRMLVRKRWRRTVAKEHPKNCLCNSPNTMHTAALPDGMQMPTAKKLKALVCN